MISEKLKEKLKMMSVNSFYIIDYWLLEGEENNNPLHSIYNFKSSILTSIDFPPFIGSWKYIPPSGNRKIDASEFNY